MILSDVRPFVVGLTATVREAIAAIDRGERGIALVIDGDGRLRHTITDGDVRRAMLAGVDLDAEVGVIWPAAGRTAHAPLTAPIGTDASDLLALMADRHIRQIPLVDAEGRVVGLATQDDLLPGPLTGVEAVVMAGGFGTRLRPLTHDMPKPMLPVGGRPLLELTVDKLRDAGIRRVNVTTHFQPEKIVGHFGDGAKFGVEVEYVQEDRPMGTAGALGLMPRRDQRLLVINGDILTHVDFRAMIAFHEEHHADLTMAVRRYEFQVPYGVVESEGSEVRTLREKPQMSVFVNAGMYLLEPSVYDFIESDVRLDMTDLIERLIGAGRRVVSFPVREYWLDIGQHADYVRANEDVGRAAAAAGAPPESDRT